MYFWLSFPKYFGETLRCFCSLLKTVNRQIRPSVFLVRPTDSFNQTKSKSRTGQQCTRPVDCPDTLARSSTFIRRSMTTFSLPLLSSASSRDHSPPVQSRRVLCQCACVIPAHATSPCPSDRFHGTHGECRQCFSRGRTVSVCLVCLCVMLTAGSPSLFFSLMFYTDPVFGISFLPPIPKPLSDDRHSLLFTLPC